MDCLVLPVSMFMKCYTGNPRLRYQQLTSDGFGELDGPVTVVVGREKREFLVDPFVLEESPFRFLLETVKKDITISKSGNYDDGRGGGRRRRRSSSSSSSPVIFVDVDAILFEHMLWLMYNDSSSLFKLNLEEIIDFYAQDY